MKWIFDRISWSWQLWNILEQLPFWFEFRGFSSEITQTLSLLYEKSTRRKWIIFGYVIAEQLSFLWKVKLYSKKFLLLSYEAFSGGRVLGGILVGHARTAVIYHKK